MTKDSLDERKKRRFRVYACSTDYVSIDIFAKNEHHALEIAAEVDGGYFQTTERSADLGSWDIVDAQEVPPDEPFRPLDKRYYKTL